MKKLVLFFKKLPIVLGVIGMFLISCEEDVNLSENQYENQSLMSRQAEPLSFERASMSLEYFARLVAKSMKESSMRHAIKEEALKKFDGDYDILYHKFAEKQLSGGNFRDLLAINGTSFDRTIERLNKIAADMPLLQIAVPVNIEKWDTDNFTPLVAILDTDYDEATTKQVRAFDSDGNLHMLDVINAPDYPVVVISQNERLIPVVKGGSGLTENLEPCQIMQSTPYFSTVQNDYYLIQYPNIFSEDCGGGGGSSGGASGGACTTNNGFNFHLKIKGLRSNNIGALDHWLSGAPELRLNVYDIGDAAFFDDGNTQNITSKFWEPDGRKDMKNKWWTFSNVLFTWDPAYGDYVWFRWYEEDGGAFGKNQETVMVAGKEYSVPLYFRDNSDFLSDDRIYRNECFKDYNDGGGYGTEVLLYRLDK